MRCAAERQYSRKDKDESWGGDQEEEWAAGDMARAEQSPEIECGKTPKGDYSSQHFTKPGDEQSYGDANWP